MDLPTYTNIWRIEKRLYKLYDFRLPMPLPVVTFGVCLGVAVVWIFLMNLLGVPFESPFHVIWIVPPGVIAFLATRPVIEGKRLTELLISQGRYATEARVYTRLAPQHEPNHIVVAVRVWHRDPAAGPLPVVDKKAAREAERRRRAAAAAQRADAAEETALPESGHERAPEPVAVAAAEPAAAQDGRTAGRRVLNYFGFGLPKADDSSPPPRGAASAPRSRASGSRPANGVPAAERTELGTVKRRGDAPSRTAAPARAAGTGDTGPRDRERREAHAEPATPISAASAPQEQDGDAWYTSLSRHSGETPWPLSSKSAYAPGDTQPMAAPDLGLKRAAARRRAEEIMAAPDPGTPRGREAEKAAGRRPREERETAAAAAAEESAAAERASVLPEPPAEARTRSEHAPASGNGARRRLRGRTQSAAVTRRLERERASAPPPPQRRTAQGLGRPATPEEARRQEQSHRPRRRPHAAPWDLPPAGGPQQGSGRDAAADRAAPADHGAQHSPAGPVRPAPARGEHPVAETPPQEARPQEAPPPEPAAETGPPALQHGVPAYGAPPAEPAEQAPAAEQAAGDPGPEPAEAGPRAEAAAGDGGRSEEAAAGPGSDADPVRGTAPAERADDRTGAESVAPEADPAPAEPSAGPARPAAPDEAEQEERAAAPGVRDTADPVTPAEDASARPLPDRQVKPPLELDHGTGEHESFSDVSGPGRRATLEELEAAEQAAFLRRRNAANRGGPAKPVPPPPAKPVPQRPEKPASARPEEPVPQRPEAAPRADAPAAPAEPRRSERLSRSVRSAGTGPQPVQRSEHGDDGVFTRVAHGVRTLGQLFTPSHGTPAQQEPEDTEDTGADRRPDASTTAAPAKSGKPGLQLDHGTGEQELLSGHVRAAPRDDGAAAPTDVPDAAGTDAPPRAPASPESRPHRPAPAPESPASGTRGWRRLARVVTGGNTPTPKTRLPEADIERLRTPFDGTRRVVVLGCTGGAGQTVTTLMLGHTLAAHRDERVVAVDVNPGGTGLSKRIRTETPETLTSLLANTDGIHGYLGMRGYTSQAGTGLEVVTTLDDPYVQTLDDRDYAGLTGLLERFYGVTLLDPAATGVARALPIVDALVLVAPASSDAARAVAMTFEWLDGHGYAGLRSKSVVVVNGVSKRSLTDVDAAEQVARGRCRAIVRVPWDDHLAAARGVVDVDALRGTTRRAHAALGGVLATGFAALPASGTRVKSEVQR
ncbi:MinD-like ATPase involved in chromosome partitioning or flagellar assembly [Spinactinospora alkalitolerans]|uniref:MinD-like ATPase involved in chromosome partitioning or flagellar assembly n=1 Tax=Spinactinospora alkalitolerans TaxID=687207 RepID=A0A852TNV9_9ACTN|nr:TcpE family conjugal transfer membrane protein [Spinactinospora alkalitolerans]NYE45638.1 MinD-like ATPase involved in chromosome partitioning or flagellar assembly [Spinactinospora alkalitolerans]